MNLFFFNLELSAETDQYLALCGIQKAATLTKSEAIIYGVHSLEELTHFVQQTQRLTSTFRVVVAPRELLVSKPFQKALSNSKAQDSVWSKEDWQLIFPTLIQQFFNWKKYQEDRRVLEELSAKTDLLIQQFERDLGLAENIQKTLLPKVEPGIPGVSLAVKYLPASGLGGDYYDIFELEDRKRFGLLVADSQTHGMAAALLTVLLKLRLEELKNNFPDSKSLVSHLNAQITAVQSQSISELSLLYGILDRTNLKFEFCAAGPLRPLLWRNSELIVLSQEFNPSVGQSADAFFNHSIFQLLPGDLLLFNTNGLEAPFKARGLSLAEGITKAFSGVRGSDPVLFQNELLAQINHYKESQEELPDDITLIQLAVDTKAIYLAQSK